MVRGDRAFRVRVIFGLSRCLSQQFGKLFHVEHSHVRSAVKQTALQGFQVGPNLLPNPQSRRETVPEGERSPEFPFVSGEPRGIDLKGIVFHPEPTRAYPEHGCPISWRAAAKLTNLASHLSEQTAMKEAPGLPLRLKLPGPSWSVSVFHVEQ
jgi:hypothetical protein